MRAALCAVAAVVLTGCGYVGDPLPPALHIPERVTDLSAIQRSDRIEIRFTAPVRTTEELGIRQFESMDLRVGVVPREFTFETWSAGAKPVEAPLPEPGKPVTVSVPAAAWAGREILVAVRFTGSRGRDSAWSNSVLLTPRSAPAPPQLKAELHPEGVRVSWPSGQARVFRGEEAVATVAATEYIDRNVELGKSYSYRAQSVDGAIESRLSEPVTITFEDRFAPKAPAGVTAVSGLDSIELAWEPNTEPDLAGYRVYRALAQAEFTVLADAVATPTFSDRQAVQTGVHRYRITAVDRAGNESTPSTIVEISR